MSISGKTIVAGVAGAPVAHSLSPLIHNAWLAAAGIDGVYVPFAPSRDGFTAFVKGLAGGAIRGLNVTVPFKEGALDLATHVSLRARRAGAANLLIFEADGTTVADNTDGAGLIAAFAAQAPGFDAKAGPVVLLGAGGAARGAASALADAGAPEIRIVNRTADRAVALAKAVGGAGQVAEPERGGLRRRPADRQCHHTWPRRRRRAGLSAVPGVTPGAVVLDMVYRPLRTAFLQRAADAGLVTVDGLEMLIRQAAPSFEAFYGAPPPDIDVRALCLAALGGAA